MRENRANHEIITNQLHRTEKKWFAVYTKYKCEKFVAECLLKKNIEAYVPIIRKTRRYNRKIKHYDIPLINCYVFVFINQSEYIATLETDFVFKFLKQGKDLLAIPQREINTLKNVVGDVMEVTKIEGMQLKSGDEVEVVSGHLTGLRGKIVSKMGKRSFVIDLETIGYQLRIKVPFNLLRLVSAKQLIA